MSLLKGKTSNIESRSNCFCHILKMKKKQRVDEQGKRVEERFKKKIKNYRSSKMK